MKPKNQNQRRTKKSKHKQPVSGDGFPERLKKNDCIYINGVVTQNAHGFSHVELENEMLAVCTSRKLDAAKISILMGDSVVVEIPTAGLEPGATRIKGRIVWRFRTSD